MVLQAWEPLGPFGPGGPSGLEALWAWGPLGPGGPSGLEVLPVDQKVVSTLFPNFQFFAYDNSLFKFIPAKPTTLQNYLFAKMRRNVQTTLGINLRPVDRTPFGPRLTSTSPQRLKRKMEMLLL